MPKVKVNDIEMYYEVHGEGEPLLLLHGLTGTSQMCKSFLPDYEPYFKVIIPDLRGHGKTTNPSRQFTARQASDDIIKLLDHLKVDKLKAMGCSSGGDILLHMATRQPDRVEAMVLDSTGPYFPDQGREAAADWTPSEENWKLLRQIHHYGEEQIRLLVKHMRDLKDSYDDMNFTKPYLSTIKAKTLIISGDRDKYYPVNIALEMYESIPESYLWVLPNTGHAVVGSQYADALRSVALDFLLGKWEEE